MKNNIYLKRSLKLILLFTIFTSCISILLNVKELKIINQNYNKQLAGIILKITEKYPNISESEIITILNSEPKVSSNFAKYGIDLENEALVNENNQIKRNIIYKNILIILCFLGLILIIFVFYNRQINTELKKITKYINQINNRNYSLEIPEMREDELSILKTELYKITIMLKESAENSHQDKLKLQKSLEDISHQLKTPLTSILIMLDNLITNPSMAMETRQEFLSDIKREITNINFLVQTLLKLSKFDAETITFKRKKIAAKNLLTEVVKNVSSICDLKNIQIKIMGLEKVFLTCDERWEREALTNILKNSLEHSFENSSILITFCEYNPYIEIKIRDWGKGISKEDLPHIFKRFYQSKNQNWESNGIGLSLAQEIIKQDNGQITVSSNQSGTTFTIKYYKF